MKKRFLLSIVLLIVIFVLTITWSYSESWIVGMINMLISIIAVLIGILIFFENRHPAKTITWLIALAFNPVIGFIFYMIFGQNYRKRRMFAQKAIQDEHTFKQLAGERELQPERLHYVADHQKLLYRLAHQLGQNPISFQSETGILTDGQETFSKIIEQLKKAKHHIHMEYYIIRDDELGNEIREILTEKVREGVQVRLLYDAVGCLDLSVEYINKLKNAGVQAVPFLPVLIPLFSNKVNFRNHRKIVVIDGEVGFIGGLNIGDEYLGKDPYFGYWRDTHLWARGEVVRTLQLIFLQDWYYMTGENLLSDEYLTPQYTAISGHGGVQMIAGGPDHRWEVIKHLFFSMIVSAKKSIWIASPYFIPDEDILSALKVACLSGIDVRLIVPAKPDKRIVFYASRSYFLELLEAGMRIFTYENGFMHSKVIIVDEELASIGSSNMDMRSFHLNFEVNCFLYGSPSIHKLADDFRHDLTLSREIVLEQFEKRSLGQRIAESFSRLASPLL